MEVKPRFVDPENVSLSPNRVVYSTEVADTKIPWKFWNNLGFWETAHLPLP